MSKDSFNELLVEALPRLRTYALWLTRNRASADDLLQEAAYRALRARDQFTMGTNFGAWMSRIVRNEFISSVRGSKKHVPMQDLPEHFYSKPAEQENVVFSRQAIQAISKLRPNHREAIELVCANGLRYDQAADAINCSTGTIKSRLWRARNQLAEMLQME